MLNEHTERNVNETTEEKKMFHIERMTTERKFITSNRDTKTLISALIHYMGYL